MDVTSATSAASTASQTAASTAATSSTSNAASAQNQLSSNFDTFLTLLTTQLQNQDPLQPMDSNQFTQQLVEFSQVEQQIDSNKNLESLISLTKSQTTTAAVSYLGKTLTLTDGTASLENGQAQWTYTLPSTAATTTLTVTDAKGHAIYSTSGATDSGSHVFDWDGKDATGFSYPPGTYKLQVTAQGADGSVITSSISSQGTIDEVDLSGTEPTLMVGTMSVPLSQATHISTQ
jgi:flagellar basal-body rod modification protein FlgD